MRPARGLLRYARDESIWGRHALSLKDARVATMLRGTLPRFYIACLIFGGLGSLGGIPALRQTFGDVFTDMWGGGLVLSTIAALIGLGYPKHLWRVEFAACALLVGLMAVYAAALLIAGVFSGDIGRASIAFGIYAMTELPQWRLRDVMRDRVLNRWS
jgi:hypothetical protein